MLKLYIISLYYDGLEVCMTVQDKVIYDNPFVYLDSIEVKKKCRGKGLSTKFLDSLHLLVKKGVFKHLNIKDYNYEFWTKMLDRYDFIRERFVTEYEDGWKKIR